MDKIKLKNNIIDIVKNKKIWVLELMSDAGCVLTYKINIKNIRYIIRNYKRGYNNVYLCNIKKQQYICIKGR